MTLFIGLTLYFTVILFVWIIYEKAGPLCKDNFWTFLRISGITMTFLFMGIGIYLWKKHKSILTGLINEFIASLKKYDEEFMKNSELATEYIKYFNKTVLKTDEKMYTLW